MREGMHVRRLRRALGIVIGVALATLACASNDAPFYAAREPVLALEKFFDGPATAVGTITDRSGKVTRRFRARAEGRWSEAEQALTVDETWYWDDGEIEPRNWRWEKLADGNWRGLEDDLTEPATGIASGNTVHWAYTMGVDTTSYGRLNIFADDVMHLVDPDNIINLVDMYFYGVYVGQVVLHIERGDARAIEPWSEEQRAAELDAATP